MADFDNQRKRFSGIDYGTEPYTLPVTDGTFATNDRIHMLGLYYGVPPTPETPVEFGSVPEGIMPDVAAIPTSTPQVFIVIESW